MASGLRFPITADNQASRTFKKVGSDAAKVAKGISVAFVAAGAAVGGVLFKIGTGVDQMRSEIVKGTGASGAALDGLLDVATKTSGEIVQGFDGAGAAVAGLNTHFGITDDLLADMTVRSNDFARVIGADTGQVVDSLGQLSTLWNLSAEDVSASMDTMTGSVQAFNIDGAALLSQLQTYGPVFQDLGLSLDETALLFGQLHQGGIDVSRISPGINAFLGNMAKEGKDAAAEMEKVVTQIQNAASESEARRIAEEAFGREGSQRIIKAIRQAGVTFNFAADDVAAYSGALDQAAQASLTLGDKWQLLKNRVSAALAPVAIKAIDAIMSLLDWVTENGPTWGALAKEHVMPFFDKITAMVKAKPGEAIAAVAGALSTIVALAWGKAILSGLAAIVSIAGVGVGLLAAAAGIGAVAAAVVAAAGGWDGIKEIWAGLKEWATETGLPAIQEAWNGFRDWVQQNVNPVIKAAWEDLSTFFTGTLGPGLKNFWETSVKPAWNTMKTWVETTGLPAIQAGWQGFWDWVTGDDGLSGSVRQAFDHMSAGLDNLKNSFDNVDFKSWKDAAVDAFNAVDWGSWGDLIGDFGDAVEDTICAIGKSVEALTTIFGKLWELFDVLTLGLGPKLVRALGGPAISFAMSMIAEGIKIAIIDPIQAGAQILGGFADVLTGLLTLDPGKIWGGVQSIVGGAWKFSPFDNAIAIGNAVAQTVSDSISNWQNQGRADLGGKPPVFMAEGGIVTRPTLAMIGEAGPEAVVPLDAGGGMGGQTINLNIDMSGSIVDNAAVDRLLERLTAYARRNNGLDLSAAI